MRAKGPRCRVYYPRRRKPAKTGSRKLQSKPSDPAPVAHLTLPPHPTNVLSPASPLSLPTSLAPSTLLLTSTTLSAQSLALPSPLDPTTMLSLSSAEWAKVVESLVAEGAATKEVEFALKGETVA